MNNILARYDKFQSEAVSNIAQDFSTDRAGRFLLVIPTGGGKTMTAVKAIVELYKREILKQKDRVVWVVHRIELSKQAKKAFTRYFELEGSINLHERIDVIMLSEVKEYINENPSVSFAVIDEAHHSAATSYAPFFSRLNFGILGLTATPSRHDGQQLPFNRESYSIGFPDLVRMGVLIQPKVEIINGGRYEIGFISNDGSGLEVLNNDIRNQRILDCLENYSDKLSKVIIYVGTQKHACDLFDLIRESKFSLKYHTVALVLGDVRRRVLMSDGSIVEDEIRTDFIDALKASPTAIIVNVDVLTEGYDDPTVNAVVMARPTKSKLIYMQAIGRAVRLDPDNLSKQAFIIEVEDELPNIRYRIDNRWLYSDVSDLLEPSVIDRFYSDKPQLKKLLESLFEEYKVPNEYRELPEIEDHDRVTLLLFKIFSGDNQFEHLPLVITNANRLAASSFFNFVSLKMNRIQDLDIEQGLRPVLEVCKNFKVLNDVRGRKLVFGSMQNAFKLISLGDDATATCKSGAPWITFVATRLQLENLDLPQDFLEFTADMVNKESVRESLRSETISQDFAIAKFPLPLSGFVGVFLSEREMHSMIAIVDCLVSYSMEEDPLKQWSITTNVIGTATLPIEKRYIEALPIIVREKVDYYRWLSSTFQTN